MITHDSISIPNPGSDAVAPPTIFIPHGIHQFLKIVGNEAEVITWSEYMCVTLGV